MSSRVSSLAIVVLFSTSLYAQEPQMVSTVKANVQKMMDATCNGDYSTVLDMTYPKVLELMGGKEAALKQIEQAMKAIKGQGITFKVKEVNNPTVVKGAKDYYSVTPYSLVMSIPNKKITLSSAVVGISADGKSWKYINLDEKGEKGVREMLPALPAELKIPKQDQKVEDIK